MNTSEKVLFKEEQRYKKPRIRYIITAVVVVLLVDLAFMVRQLLAATESQAGESDERIVLLITTLLLVVIATVFIAIFTRLKMITQVTQKSIQVFYPPLLRRGKLISREEIDRYEIRQYKPLVEFGGWGIKTRGRPLRQRRYGKALTAYGRTGLQLYLKNGKKFLIGTQRPEPLKYAISKMFERWEAGPVEKENL